MPQLMRFRGELQIATAFDPPESTPDSLSASAGPLASVGDIQQFDLELSNEQYEHVERWSGSDTSDFVFTEAKGGKVSLQLDEALVRNMSLVLNSHNLVTRRETVVNLATYWNAPLYVGGNLVGHVYQNDYETATDLAVGSYVYVAADVSASGAMLDRYGYISETGLVLKTYNGTAYTALTKDVDYALDADFSINGKIQILLTANFSGAQGPLVASFSMSDAFDYLTRAIVKGAIYGLSHGNILNIASITDSATTPLTVPARDYSVVSAQYGEISFGPKFGRNAGDTANVKYTYPLVVNYGYSQETIMPFQSNSPTDYRLRLKGFNVFTGRPCDLIVYRVNFPAGTLKMLEEKAITLPMTGNIKHIGRTVRPSGNWNDNPLGVFGFLRYLDNQP